MTNPDNIKALYKELQNTYELGSEDEFRQYLSDANNREALRKELSADYDVGDSASFSQYLGFVDEPTPSAAPTQQQKPAQQQPKRTPAEVYSQAGDERIYEPDSSERHPLQRQQKPSKQQPTQQENILEQEGNEPLGPERFAKAMEAQQALNNIQKIETERREAIQKGNTPFGGQERRYNPVTKKFENVYYTPTGDVVGSETEQQRSRMAVNDAFAQTDLGKAYKEAQRQADIRDRAWGERKARMRGYDKDFGVASEEAWNMANERTTAAQAKTALSKAFVFGDPLSNAVMLKEDQFRNQDLTKMSDDAWNNLGKEKQEAIIEDYIGMLKSQYSGGDGEGPTMSQEEAERILREQAEKMARAASDQKMYEVALAKNAPENVADFFMRKVIGANMITKLIEAAARATTGSNSAMQVRDEANQKFEDSNKAVGLAGTVVGMGLDPTTWAAGAVGGAATKGALWLGGKVAGEAATRKFATTLAGRTLSGIVGGAGNFGTFESANEMLDQVRMGGHRNEETGEIEGYDLGAVAKRFGHGVLMGSASGTVAPLLGNVSDKLVNATSSTFGKAGVRAGELGVSTLAEGTIFSIPEWIDGDRDAMDVWTDNLAMMLAFKGQHVAKSGIRAVNDIMSSNQRIAELRGLPRREVLRGWETRLRDALNGHEGMALTREEADELKKAGYDDLNQLVEDYNDYIKSGKENGSIGPERQLTGRDGEIPYNRFEMLMNDGSVSEAARAKMYYYLTGKTMPMSTVMGSSIIEYTDDKGNVTGYTVRSIGANGVITSRNFNSKSRAAQEVEKINRQVELNSIDIGERYYDRNSDQKRMFEACETVARAKGVPARSLYEMMQKDREGMSDVERTLVDEISKAYDEIDANKYASGGIRNDINEEYKVNIDSIIKKEPKRRSEWEQSALDDYVERLWADVQREEIETAPDGRRRLYAGDPSADRETDAFNNGYDADEEGQRDIMTEAEMGGEPTAEQQAAVDGVRQRIEDDADMFIAGVRDAKKPHLRKDGSEQLATLKEKDAYGNDKVAYIVDGNVVMTPDGSMVDPEASDRSIVIFDPATGEKKMIDPTSDMGILHADPIVTADEIELNLQNERQRYIQQRLDEVQGKVNVEPGQQIAMPDGTQATVIAADGENITIQTADGQQQTMPQAEVQRIADELKMADYMERHPESQQETEQPTEETSEQPTDNIVEGAPSEFVPNTRIMVRDDDGESKEAVVQGRVRYDQESRQFVPDENGQVIEYLMDGEMHHDQINALKNKVEGYVAAPAAETETAPEEVATTEQQEPPTEQTEEVPTTEEMPTEEPTASEQAAPAREPMPMHKVRKKIDGKMQEVEEEDYMATTPARAYQYLYEEAVGLGLKPETADNLVQAKIKAAQNGVEKSAKATGPIVSILQKQRDAQAEVDYWNEVKNLRSQAMLEEVERTREQRAAEAKQAAERREQRRNTEIGEAGSTPSEKYNTSNKIVGNKVSRTIADKTKIKGHYVLVEADALTPSHDPFNGWKVSEGFPTTEDGKSVNDRVYEGDKEAQDFTESIALVYDGQAVSEIPVVSSEGIVYDGNGRTMAGQIAARNNTDAEYIEALMENAANFGFTEEQVQSMSHPRVVMQVDEDMPYNATTFARFNKDSKKKMNNVNKAVSIGKQMTDSARDAMLDILDRYGTIDTFFGSEVAAADVVNMLVDGGFITQQEVPAFKEKSSDGKMLLSADGRSFVTNTLLGTLFDEEAIRRLGDDKDLKNSLLRAVPKIAENRRLGDYALTDEINTTIELLYDARRNKMTFDQYKRQGNLVEGMVEDRYEPIVVILADELSSGVDNFRTFLTLWNETAANDAATGGETLFGKRTKEDLKKVVIEYYKSQRNNDGQHNDKPAAGTSERRPENEETVSGVGDIQEDARSVGAAATTEQPAAEQQVAEQSETSNPTAEQRVIGQAMVDQLENMGEDVVTDLSEMRRVHRQAEQDKSESGRLRHFRAADGKIYGFTYRGKIYLDPRRIDAELPIHEYAHPWCEAFRMLKPDGWKDVVNMMRGDRETWELVKALNPDLTDPNDIVEEMIARGSGKNGKARAEAEYRRMGKGSNFGNVWNNIAKAIQDFWKKIGDFLNIKYETPEQIYDQVVKDFANKVNPRKRIDEYLKERDAEYLQAVESGDEAKARELFDAALRENIGNGMTPYVAAGKYRGGMDRLARGVKSRDPKVIAEVADLLAPLIPENAVLVPAPSHSGTATDMLDVANAIAERTGAPVADVLRSEQRASQYDAKRQGQPISSSNMGIRMEGQLPEGRIPIVIDNVVDTGNTAEACIKALGKGVVVSLADAADRRKHVASLKSANVVARDKNGNVVPLSQRFTLGGSNYLAKQKGEQGKGVSEMQKALVNGLVNLIRSAKVDITTAKREGQRMLDKYRAMARLMNAWHGSAADFERFDEKYIGSGNGGARYGAGWYVAKDNSTAKFYALNKARDGKNPIVYEVEIPDDNGSNYLDWFATIPKKERHRIAEAIRKIPERYLNREWHGQNWMPGGFDQLAGIIEKNPTGGMDLYSRLSDATINFSVKDFLHDLGYVGTRYKEWARDNAIEYVIYNDDDIKITDKIRFHKAENGDYVPEMKPTFYSNAMKAVEGIKQEKATAEQWMAMLQKNGGLKAGEDKWIGLSDWLNEHKGKSLTKQEVMDYIRNNQIEIEEVNYAENIDIEKETREYIKDTFADGKSIDELQQEVDENAESADRYDRLGDNPDQEDLDEYLMECMVNEYGDDFRRGYSISDGSIEYDTQALIDTNDIDEYNREVAGNDNKAINETRKEYTTDFLDNKREIALTIPTIEPWNEGDEVHFGDAGDGRAVAWVRFGETYTKDTREQSKAIGVKYIGQELKSDIDKEAADCIILNWGEGNDVSKDRQFGVAKSMAENALNDNMPYVSEEQQRHYKELLAALNKFKKEDFEAQYDNGECVLVIDEIQSKRHQEGREKGYVPKELTDLRKQKKAIDKELLNLWNEFYEKYGEDTWSNVSKEDENRRKELYSRRDEISEKIQELEKEVRNNSNVPDAPFEKNWHEVAMKRMLRYAAENGYDKVAWTTGEQQAERYNIGKVVDAIDSRPYKAQSPSESDGHDLLVHQNDGTTWEMFVQPDGTLNSDSELFDGKNVMEVFGKEMGSKIMASDKVLRLDGESLRVGAEGMKGFYDQILPRFMDKYGKKWNVKTTDINLPNIGDNGLTMHSIDVTPEMKVSVMEGQPMFFRTEDGEVWGYALNGKIYIDPSVATPETPIHEYTHLWTSALRKVNPAAWERLKDEMRRQEKLMDYVRSKYPELTNEDELLDEVFAHYSGKRGAERLEADMREAIAKEKDYTMKAQVAMVFHKLRDILQKFWSMSRDLFAGKVDGVETMTAEDFADMAMGDLMNGFNPVEAEKNSSSKMDKEYADAVERGDMETAQRMVDEAAREAGYTIHAYHGTGRADRVGNVFRPERATSGPMAFFTDNKQIASKYSTGKQDTSIAYEDEFDSYQTQFRAKHKATGKDYAIYDMWGFLPRSVQNQIAERAGHIRSDLEGDGGIIYDPDTKDGNGAFQGQIADHRGNVLRALTYHWLESGQLYNNEADFLKVLEMAGVNDALQNLGFEMPRYMDPNYRDEAVYDVYLKIENPFDATTMVDEEFIKGFEEYAAEHEDEYEDTFASYDMWDKHSINAEDFADAMRDDIKSGHTFAWTRIPDIASDYLKSLGYDGIKDTGGKNGGDEHTVWIPFKSEQIKRTDPVTYDDQGNVIPLSKRFDNESKDIRYQKEGEQTRTDAFKNFFGDWEKTGGDSSKVVDEEGKPLVVYHGTFDRNATGQFSTFNTPAFFSSDEETARIFTRDLANEALGKLNEKYKIKRPEGAKGYVYPVYLNIRKPKYIDFKGKAWGSDYKLTQEFEDAVAALKTSDEYDGVIALNIVEGGNNKIGNVTTTYVVKNPSQIKSATGNNGDFDPDNNDIYFRSLDPESDNVIDNAEVGTRPLSDREKVAKLEAEPKVKVYRSMQLIDGELYPPMSAKSDGQLREPSRLGVWEEADERPDMADDNGKFTLNKGNGKSLKAAYNPYIHTSRTMLNDQFSEAQTRPNLVVVEMEVPESELTSDYKAEKAKDSVGAKQWKAGVIQGQLSGTREVILSRWAKPVRIVPDSEVAASIAEQIKGQVAVMPSNVVTPSVRAELEKLGVQFVETDNSGRLVDGPNKGKTWSKVYGKNNANWAMSREGDGISNARTYGEALASARRAGYTKKQFDQMLKDQERRHRQRVADFIDKLNLSDRVTVVDSIDDVEGLTKEQREQRKDKKGWYDRRNGRIVIILDNHHSVDDILKTVLHEGVAHHGLRALFGKNFDNFIGNVYAAADYDVRKRINELAKRKNWDIRTATEEYLAGLAEDTEYDNIENSPYAGWWTKIKTLFFDMLHKLGIAGEKFREILSDNELRYLLWRSYKNLTEPGRFRSFVDEAEDVVMQDKLKVGDYEVIDYAHPRQGGERKRPDDAENTPKDNAYWNWVESLEGDMYTIEEARDILGKAYLEYPHATGERKEQIQGAIEALRPWIELMEQDEDIQEKGTWWSDAAEQQSDAVVLGHDGDTYKAVGKSADAVSKSLGIPKAADGSVSFPADDIDKNLPKLVRSGLRVGIAERLPEGASEDDVMFRDGDDTPNMEQISESILKEASRNTADAEARDNAMRAIGDNLENLRKAMSLQREFDRNTVNRVTRLAKALIGSGYLDGLRSSEVKRLLSAVENSTGKENIKGGLQKVMDIMIDNQLRHAEDALHKLESIRGSRVDAKGVEVQGQLDVAGQRMVETFKKARNMNREDVETRLLEAEERMGSDDDIVANEAMQEHAGLQMALDYIDNIRASEMAIEDLERDKREEERKIYEYEEEPILDEDGNPELKKDGTPKTIKTRHVKTEYKNTKDNPISDDKKREKEQVKQTIQSIEDGIRKEKIDQLKAYVELISNLGGTMRESMEQAKAWREAQKERVAEIQHNANSDMEGRPSDEHNVKDTTFLKKVNNLAANTIFAPLSTFTEMLRLFGNKSAGGEGYLFNRFVRGFIDARQKEIRGVRSKYAILDAKAREVFGDGVKDWADVMKEAAKGPRMMVNFWDGGKMQPHELHQGNLMYIYMVDKMSDGRMKLRKMGITDADVDAITEALDPRLKELADWLQEEFLVDTRKEYNETHKRMFGASMAEVENYFPLKILANARVEKPEDLDAPERNEGISTRTGSIIKRTANTLALDLTGADALHVILDHVAQMEHWNAFAEYNRDLNTLRTYKRFRNQVQNMTTLYGNGKELWEKFNEVSQMVTGAYHPKQHKLDKGALEFAQGVTSAKVSFRINTALKQLLSLPAYLPYVNAKGFFRSIANNLKNSETSFQWCMKHLPMFEERWKSRVSGDPRLAKTAMDWQSSRANFVQKVARVGMLPNAFVDALTVSIGAHAVYETRLNEYLKEGYKREDAEKKAIQDAEIAYNETQQSSEGGFLSTMQRDRTWLSVMFTVFRNASMAYQRQLIGALRNLGNNLTKEQREDTLAYETKQMVREGIPEEQAEAAAKNRLAREMRKNALAVATFGFIVQFAWNLGGKMWYLLFGDDDDEKSEMWKDVWAQSMYGGVEGLTGGDIMSELGRQIVRDDYNPRSLDKDMPLSSDLASMMQKFGQGKAGEALNDMLNLIVQAGIGVNPQSLTDIVLATMDMCGNDVELSREALIFATRVLQVPQSQIKKMYFDEIGMNGEDAQKMSVEELVERYARYQVKRGRMITPWQWDDEELLKKEEEKGMNAVRERMKNMDTEELINMRYTGDMMKSEVQKEIKRRMDENPLGSDEVNEAYQRYEDKYKELAEYNKKANELRKTDPQAARAMKEDILNNKSDLYIFNWFKPLDGMYDEMAKQLPKAKSQEEYQRNMDTLIDYRTRMVEALGETDEQRSFEIRNSLFKTYQDYMMHYVERPKRYKAKKL